MNLYTIGDSFTYGDELPDRSKAWDHPITSPNYIGRFVEWAYGTPQGPGGHPLELGHRRIADEILRNIRH